MSGISTYRKCCQASNTAIECMAPTILSKDIGSILNKVLLDPYAKGIGRDVKWNDAVFGYRVGDPEGDLSFDDRDSAAYAPLAIGD